MVENKYLSSASTYHDMSGLQKLRTGAKNNDDQALVAVAKQLEGVFLNMMLKSMRQANSVFAEGNPMNSKETEFYQGMYDQQISLTMSEGKGIGLADVIVRQMRGMHTDRAKIDELMAARNQILRLRHAHLIEMRKSLTDEQKVGYDKALLQRSAVK